MLSYFGSRGKEAILRYEELVSDGINQGGRPDLVGGGLIRSQGGWSQVLSMRRKGIGVASDDRSLGKKQGIEGTKIILSAGGKEDAVSWASRPAEHGITWITDDW